MRKMGLWALLLAVVGCENFELIRPDVGLREVSANPFGATSTSARVPKGGYAPASKEIALLVDSVGKKIGETNPHLGVKPLFATIGHPDLEIFNDGSNIVYVTEGMVRACKSEGELAAVLSTQLASLVAERERKLPPEIRQPEKLPPISLPISGGGQREAADPTYKVEIAQYEKERPRHLRGKVPTPNKTEIAKKILDQAGYPRTDLDAVGPLLQRAERNVVFENQMKGPGIQGDWQR